MKTLVLMLVGLLVGCSGSQRVVVDVTKLPNGNVAVKRCDLEVVTYIVTFVSIDPDTCQVQELE